MKALLLAAGKGTRFGELTKKLPKPLIPVGGIPLIVHTLEALPNEISECSIVLGHLGAQIRSELGIAYKNRTIIYIEQRYPGTGGALLSAREEFRDQKDFMVLGTDDLFGKDELKNLLTFCPGYGVIHQPSPNKYQKREPVLDSSGCLTGFRDTRPGKATLCDVGAYFLTNQVFNEEFRSLGNGEFSIPDTVAASIPLARAVILSNWIPVNDQEELIAAEKYLTENPGIFP